MPKLSITSAQTIGEYFKEHYPEMPFSLLQTWLRKGEVKYNSQPTNIHTQMVIGGILKIPPAHFFPNKIKNNSNRLMDKNTAEIIINQMMIKDYPDFFIINKNAGMAVQGGTGIAPHETLDMILRSMNSQYCLTHRLDKETSGIMIIAKNKTSARNITALFREKKIMKTYHAICYGRPNNAPQGIMNESLTHSAYNEYMEINEHGLPAETHWALLQESPLYNYLQLQPISGRKHQLRVHCAYHQCPIVGDKKYGHKNDFPYLLLHAKKISLPYNNQIITIESELPVYFAEFLQNFKKSPNIQIFYLY